MSNNFYRAFEDKHRGSVEDIRQRLKFYLPLVNEVLAVYPDAAILDIGCGRGEWLKLLRDNNIEAIGVDLDSGMLQAAYQEGLKVVQQDCIEYLQQQKNDSLSVITGFHLVEHLDFSLAHLLVEESLRVLKPGGLLILETPNPENISVGTCSFYMDPTHKNPLPPELLRFLPDYYGFSRAKVVRLQESSEVKDSSAILTLTQVLKGVSPDYSVIAQKNGNSVLLDSLDHFFSEKKGVTLDELADRYDTGIESKIDELKRKSRKELKIFEEELRDEIDKLVDHKLEEVVNRKIDEHVSHKMNNVVETNIHLQQRIDAILNSNSWKLTAPLRRLKNISDRTLVAKNKGSRYLLLALCRKIFTRLLVLSHKYPRAKSQFLAVLRKVGLHSMLRKLYRNSVINQDVDSHHQISINNVTDYDNLTNRSKMFYEKMKSSEADKKRDDKL